MIFSFKAFKFWKSTVWSLSPLLYIRDLFAPQGLAAEPLEGSRSSCESNLAGEALALRSGFVRRIFPGSNAQLAVTSNNAPPIH